MTPVWMAYVRNGLSRLVVRLTAIRYMVFLLAVAGLPISPVAAQTTSPATPQSAPSTAPAELSPIDLSVNIASTTDASASQENAVKLVSIGTPDAVTAVISIIKTENNQAAKLAICRAIAQVKAVEPAYKEHLLKMLSHPEISIQKAAYEALDNYADPDVVATLQSYHQQEERRLLKEAVIRNAQARYEALPPADRRALLAEWLASPLTIERLIAMEYIHADLRKGTPPADAQLNQIRSLLNSPDVDVRLKAILIVRDCHEATDAELIRNLLTKKEHSPARKEQPVIIREALYNALGKLAEPASLPICIAGLKDPVETVAAEAAGALGRVMELKTGIDADSLDEAVQALLTRAAQPMTSAKLRENVLDAMATIGDETFLPIMVNHVAASETDPVVRQAAIRGLGRIADPAQTPLVLQQLGDPDTGVRTAAVGAIEMLFQAQLAAGKKDDAAAILEKAIDANPADPTNLAGKLIALYLNNPGPEKALRCAARLQPKAREAVADQFHKHASGLVTTDPANAVAFLDQLKTYVPDQFGATWAPKFNQLRNSLQAPETQPATTSTS